MGSKQLYQSLQNLNFVRVSRTKEEKEAALIIKNEVEEAGGTAVIEEFEVSDWKIKQEKFYVNEPVLKEYEVTAYGCSLNTNGPLTAPFYYLESFTEVSRKKAKDCIVLVNGYLSYDTYKEIVNSGAVGFITYSNDVYDDKSNSDLDIRELRKQLSDIKKLPGVHMRTTDAMELIKSNPTLVTIDNDQDEFKATSQNVISEIKGELDEEIVFTAHYDSVPFSRGVYDNGAGSAILLELYRYFISNKPKRTLRFIWCGSEERGLLGSKAFVKKHNKQLKNIVLCINVDVAGPVLGKDAIVVMANKDAVKFVEEYRTQIEYVCDVKSDTYSSDSIPFADKGIPAISFARIAPTNTATIHNSYDTKKVMKMEHMEKDIAFITSFTEIMANAKRLPVEKEIPDKMKEKLDIYLLRKRDDKKK